MPDFEILPLGSMEELGVLREFACWISQQGATMEQVELKVKELNQWYTQHNQRYPEC
jgi:hypothetical protein